MEIKKGLMQSDGMGMGGKLGMPRLLMLQAGAAYLPPQGEGIYAGSGYGPGKDVLYEHPMVAGYRGTDFYRNQ
jgi:hypothetical protein